MGITTGITTPPKPLRYQMQPGPWVSLESAESPEQAPFVGLSVQSC